MCGGGGVSAWVGGICCAVIEMMKGVVVVCRVDMVCVHFYSTLDVSKAVM